MNSNLILLAVTGLSPQVVTETLYAMHRQGDKGKASARRLTRARILLKAAAGVRDRA
jgi:CRISPR-associated protein (TIGR02584 family)